MDLERLVIENIKRIRKEKGISQEKLAEYCGTSASYIGLMETYKNIPKLSTIQKIADALDIPAQELFISNNSTDKNKKSENQKTVLKNKIKKQFLKDAEKALDSALKMI